MRHTSLANRNSGNARLSDPCDDEGGVFVINVFLIGGDVALQELKYQLESRENTRRDGDGTSAIAVDDYSVLLPSEYHRLAFYHYCRLPRLNGSSYYFVDVSRNQFLCCQVESSFP